MITLSSAEKKAPVGRKPIFSIDGQEYTVPVDVPGWMALEYVEKAATEGEAVATRWVMVQVLGQAGYDALRGFKALEKSDLAAIQKIIRELVMGETEEEGKG